MKQSTRFTMTVALIVALGGFLMGFDASVISGVVGFIETDFDLTKIELGWSVSSLALTATLAMMLAGPISDRIGRRPVLKIAAVLFALSAIASAVAPNFILLVIARMVGGLGVGAALIIAPMYIAEIAPAEIRGRMVSFNQLNIVIGISAAFFSNYLILTLGQSDLAWAESLRFGEWNWRWMLGIETLPAIVYFFALFIVPESPRWLALQGREDEARDVLERVSGAEQAAIDLQAVHDSIEAEAEMGGVSLKALFHPSMKLVLTIGISVGILQQITGINSVFFYSPMIFEQSGIGTNAAFMQAVLVGLVNLGFTIVAMALIDKLGRRPLLGFGMTGIAICMLTLAYGFGAATYTLDQDAIDKLPAEIDRLHIATVADTTYDSDIDFREAVSAAVGEDVYKEHESPLVSNAINMNPTLILFAILGFVASFAISIGPIMWVLFSELFPNNVRGMAISFVGLINSAVAFLVTFIFPWELQNIGNAGTFLIYGLFAVFGLFFVMRLLPETKGRSLEELEQILVRN
ncbi:MAG: sugar porter family MFS transporter [Gammaproteobacteria bacterium]|nr:sugar porter family MFS transporter [Gammaproteobacteria bacterium]MDH3408309.1 sugar porter family MFS transporter [Gammaproteobacteria bacterium]MDH3552533.1 sugar porter family MFS transporter [Gammaproteobacteria bacterium]